MGLRLGLGLLRGVPMPEREPIGSLKGDATPGSTFRRKWPAAVCPTGTSSRCLFVLLVQLQAAGETSAPQEPPHLLNY